MPGMLVEELPREPGDVGEAAVAGGARGDGGVEPGLRLGDQHRQVVRMSPGAALLRPGRGGGTAHHRGEHVGCGLLAHVPERLERLVGEVDGVPAVDEDVVGDGGEHHALHIADRARFRQRGREHELGRVARTGFDESAVPLGEPDPFDLAAVVERAQGEARRVVAGVAGDEREPVHQRQRTVRLIEHGEHVRHRDEHGETGTPSAVAVARAEGDAAPHDLVGGDPGLEQPQHRLRQHQREPRLQAVVEPLEEMGDRIVAAARFDEHVVTVDGDLEAAGVVGERIEGAPGDEVEAGVVPVAGHEPGLDGPLVQREAHVRAAVLDRPGAVVVPEHHDRQRADLGQQATFLAQLVERPGTHRHAPTI